MESKNHEINEAGIFNIIGKITFLLILQTFLGYGIIWLSLLIAKDYKGFYPIVSYFMTLLAISYTIYCYFFSYRILKERFMHSIKLIKTGLVVFYLISLLSYTFVSGSYSPFFLIGIKLAQKQFL